MKAPIEVSVESVESGAVDVEGPFELSVREEGQAGPGVDAAQVLHCEQILRYLPGRRLVVRTRWTGRPAVLKLFMGEGAAGYRDRESAGLKALRSAGARVPEQFALVQGGQAPAGVGIVMAFLADARSLSAENTALVDALVGLFARLHAQGFYHRDPHLGNFLTAGGELHVVDGDGIRTAGRTLSVHGSLGNLGELLAQFPPAADSRMEGLIRAYIAARGWSASASTAPARAALAAARRNRYRRYLKKTRRTCSEFEATQDPVSQRIRIRAPGAQLPATFFGAPDVLLSHGQILKAGNSATVVRCALGQDAAQASLVIKRYNVKGWGQALRRSLSPLPRFRRAWSYGALLHLLDIPTARPLALLEKGIGPWRPRAWLLLEDLGDRDLGVELREALGCGDEARIAARIAEVVGLFGALRAARLVHGDTKASNFLVYQNRVHLIDLDAMTLVPGRSRGSDQDLPSAGFTRDIARFLENWEGDLGTRFEAAFRTAGLL